MDSKRFKVIYKQGTLATGTKVLKDSKTGVLYLWHAEGYAGGLTPLLDKDGKPTVDPGR